MLRFKGSWRNGVEIEEEAVVARAKTRGVEKEEAREDRKRNAKWNERGERGEFNDRLRHSDLKFH